MSAPPVAAGRGFSLVELIAAMVILGLALTVLFPMAVTCSRTVGKLEERNPETGRWHSSGTDLVYDEPDPRGVHPNDWYLVPASERWAGKLGVAASLVDTAPSGGASSTSVPPSFLIDNTSDSDPAFTADADWTYDAGNGYLGDSHRLILSGIASTAKATWTFQDVPGGCYRVQATWPTVHLDQLGNAQYRAYDGDNQLLAESLVNQKTPGLAPITFDGATWYDVASIYVPGTTATVRVELTTPDITGEVAADAIRLVGNTVDVRSLTKQYQTDGSLLSITVTVSVEFP